MAEEPLFDPSLKKRSKKKQVAFSEDPLGADADPTTPAPAVIDNHTTNGDAVDMGPTTMHEQMVQNGVPEPEAPTDDFKAMFGDLKKKKKKKDIPLDLVSLIYPDCFQNFRICFRPRTTLGHQRL
jgi:translation initiation factor 2 subunit 2